MAARLLELEALGLVGVDAAEAEHGGNHVGVAGEPGAGRDGDVEVAGGVDHDLAEDGLAALLALGQDAGDAAVLDEGAGELRVQAEVDAGFGDHVVAGALPAVGVEGDGVADRVRLGAGVEVEQAPTRPFAEHGGVVAALVFGRVDGEAAGAHALDQLGAEAAHGDFRAGAHVVQHEHHAAGGEAAEIGVALHQADAGALAGCRHGRAHAGGAAADHDHVGSGGDGYAAAGLGNGVLTHGGS